MYQGQCFKISKKFLPMSIAEGIGGQVTSPGVQRRDLGPRIFCLLEEGFFSVVHLEFTIPGLLILY